MTASFGMVSVTVCIGRDVITKVFKNCAVMVKVRI